MYLERCKECGCNKTAEDKVQQWEPWMAAFGRLIFKHRIVRVPEDLEDRLDRAQVMEEVLYQVSAVYNAITRGRISKPETLAGEVLGVVEEIEEGLISEVQAGRKMAKALPIIVWALLYCDFDEGNITWKDCTDKWLRYAKPALKGKHSGDCTDEPHSCARCLAEQCVALADRITTAVATREEED